MPRLVIPIELITRYQQGERLNPAEQKVFHLFITDVTELTWRTHFKKQRSDWFSSREIRDSVPLAFLEYLKLRKSDRRMTHYCGRRAYYCSLDAPPMYVSPVVCYLTFKRQFPRILTVLTAQHYGVSLVNPADQGYYAMPYLVALPQAIELHKATVLLRQLHQANGDELYSAHSAGYVEQVLKQMVKPTTGDRVRGRRAMVVNAAVGVLHMRIQDNLQFTKRTL